MSGLNSRWKMRKIRALTLSAGVGLTALLMTTSIASATQPGQAWNVDFIDIRIAPGAPLSLYNPRGDDSADLDVRVSGVVRTGLREAMRGYFLGDRRTRMVVVVNRFEGISTGETLLVGGEMQGELEIEIRDPLSGDVLARSGPLDFSRVVASGLLGFGAMIAGGGSQERKYADEISKVSRGWMNALDCLDESCSVARGFDSAPTALAAASDPQPEPKPKPAPIAEPEPVEVADVTPVPDPVPQPSAAPAEPEPSEDTEVAVAPVEPKPEPEPEPEIAEPVIETTTPALVEAPAVPEADAGVAVIATGPVVGAATAPATPEPVAAPRSTPVIATPEPEPEPEPDLVPVVPAAAPSAPVEPSTGADPVVVTGLTQNVVAGSGVDQPTSGGTLDIQPVAKPIVEPEPDPNAIAEAPKSLTGGATEAGSTGIAPAGLSSPEASEDATLALLAPAPAPEPADVDTSVLEPAPVEVTPEPEPEPEPEPAVEAEPEPDVPQPAVQPLVNPAQPVAKPVIGLVTDSEALAPAEITETLEPVEEEEITSTVETRISAVDPAASGPTLANAQWIGFTPAVFGDGGGRAGLWIAGPFDRRQRTGWITDTATGATTRVTFVWREAAPGTRALLSGEA
ncbi:MAG: hypothetical protein AAF501_01050, partial [Pseudomonadota bacterium]